MLVHQRVYSIYMYLDIYIYTINCIHNFKKLSTNYITCVEDGAPSCVFESEATIKLEDTSQIHSNTCQKRWKSLNRPECQKEMLQQVTSHHLSQLASPSSLVYPTRLCPQGRSTLNFLEALQVDREAETSAERTESWDDKAWRENVRWWLLPEESGTVRLAYTTLCLDVAEYIYICIYIYIHLWLYMPSVWRYRYRWSMCIHTHMYTYVHVCMHAYRQTDRQTDRHTDTHTHTYIYIYI